MGDTIYNIARDKKVKRQPIEDAIQNILRLDEEKIKTISDLYVPFKILTSANNKAKLENKSILEFLTDEDLIYIIEKFKHSLPKVSGNIDRMEEAVKDLEQVKAQKTGIERRMEEISVQMIQKQAELGSEIPEEPGAWALFITDKNPGYLKSFFLLFVPQASIDEAQQICDDHDKYLSVRADIEGLTSENNGLQERLGSKEIEIQQKEQIRTELTELKRHTKILANNVAILDKSANSLITSPEIRPGIKENIEKEPIQDDDMMFSMDL
ncbi:MULTISPECIES: hypothetical protein [Legionella]|uniref:Uncharacterized protein n=1 Tax=Legionella resiliens TaxID=2905958 RepID=A0ABS8X0M1_9GAMM|nr:MULTISPECIES: hypothetical protein [unclassified Legionella]MCE0721686.1 hypothetical protein [Legionella sp. 9fVS26]MCE3530840.1 hypothetical protein [Legionella sp. 8cVS16]QLZ70401.1 hypothetical protein FOLKNPGA_03215 [Legionella sp. PC1000]